MAGRVSELIFTADNRSAVRALKQISDQSTATTRTLTADADEQTVAMAKVKESSEAVRDSFSGMAGMVGIAGVAFGFKDLIEGGLSLQSAQANLRASLTETGQTAAGVFGQMQETAENLSTHGGFSTVESLQGMAALVRETHSATEATKLNSLATDIARAKGLDLASAQSVVARAYTGSVGRLQQLLGPMVAHREATVHLSDAHQQLINSLENEAQQMGSMGSIWLRQQEAAHNITAQESALAEMTDKHATAQQVLAAATKEFGGYAQNVFSNTTAGRLQNFQHGLQNLEETLGEGLLPDLNKFVGVLTEASDWMRRNEAIVRDLALTAAGLGAAFAFDKLVKGINGLRKDLVGVARMFGIVGASEQVAGAEGVAAAEETGIAWDTLMTTTILGVAVVGLIELVEHWKQVKAIAVDAWHGIEAGAEAAFGFIKAHWQLIASILGGPFVAAGLFIADHWDQIKHGATSVWHTLERIFKEIGDAITFPFRKAFEFIESGFNKIKSIAGSVGHFITHPFGLGLSTGGVVPKYLASGGPSGTDTVPAWLTPDEGVVNTRGMQLLGDDGLGAINSGSLGLMNSIGGGGGFTITPGVTVVKIGDEAIARAMTRYALNRAARGPSSLIGGSLATAAPGLPA